MRADKGALERLAKASLNRVSVSPPLQVLAELAQADPQGDIGRDRPQVSEEEEAQEVALIGNAECHEEFRFVCEHLQEETVDEHIK